MQAHVYILASRYRGTLYVGSTQNLPRRVWEHRTGKGSAFTCRYAVMRLVYAEPCASVLAAVEREYRLKRWRRSWKFALIEQRNPDWVELYEALCGP